MRNLHLKCPFAGDSRPPSHPQLSEDPAAGQQPPHPAAGRQPQEPDSAVDTLLRQQFHRTRGGRCLPGEDTPTPPLPPPISFFLFCLQVSKLLSALLRLIYFFFCTNCASRSSTSSLSAA
ncbi:hypothetical protein CEXT_290301 [Caerostris extrusa]|uniref:Uncharacterized protein n=1 Tax=Caerostris extrusa TaxID=172846 RepID=A0AAV4UE82_CAEEX|nr:hypothetical protein CEXT_290301 [Caerostris extrusa]